MLAANTLKELKQWGEQFVQNVVDQLNDIGIVSDEDEHGFSSVWIEHWDGNCTKYFRQFGYEGGPLGHHAKYFPDHGAVYVLFDEGQHDLESAEKYLRSKVGAF